jgi:putative chitinase
MIDITPLQGKLPDKVYHQLPAALNDFAIVKAVGLAHFLSQCAYESENFTALNENLNYSAAGLLRIFPSHFSASLAAAYAHQPEKIANRVYADRLGNGDEASGDGWKYRGRGYIQLTGKENYAAFGKFIKNPNIIDEPDLVATQYPLASAGFFFRENNLFAIANEGTADAVVKKITKLINGGYNGLAARTALFHTYYQLLVPQGQSA